MKSMKGKIAEMKVMSKTFVGNSENICFTVIEINFNGVLFVIIIYRDIFY